MTAQELYEIVKDVPEAVWPKDIRYAQPIKHADGAIQNAGGAWSVPEMNTSFYFAPAPVALIEAAFVGAMVAWLIGEGYHVHGWDSNSDDGTATLVLYDREFTVSTDKYRGMGTLVALLAAACKEAK